MPNLPGMNSDVYFGSAENDTLPNWRASVVQSEEEDDDEDEVQPGVRAMLGFDPNELDDLQKVAPDSSVDHVVRE